MHVAPVWAWEKDIAPSYSCRYSKRRWIRNTKQAKGFFFCFLKSLLFENCVHIQRRVQWTVTFHFPNWYNNHFLIIRLMIQLKERKYWFCHIVVGKCFSWESERRFCSSVDYAFALEVFQTYNRKLHGSLEIDAFNHEMWEQYTWRLKTIVKSYWGELRWLVSYRPYHCNFTLLLKCFKYMIHTNCKWAQTWLLISWSTDCSISWTHSGKKSRRWIPGPVL